jgi:RHS repeat-associated protein
MTGDGTRSFTFDKSGRVKQIGTTKIKYDIFDNMITYGTNVYSYDANKQRIKKIENSNTTYYITSGPTVLEEYGTDNTTPKAIYVYGIDGLVATIDPTKGYFWIYKDHLGSTRHTNVVSGQADMARDYYPFGADYYAAGDQTTNHRFSGKELDSGIGLYYFGSRYYDHSLGRWLVPDPAGQGWSPYVYCGNRPLIMVDPEGKFFLELIVFGLFNAISNAPNIHDFSNFAGYFGVGALGYAIAPIGNASNFWGNVSIGALQGGLLGGLNSSVSGGFRDFDQGFRSSALWGSVFGVITSEQFQNSIHRGGWNSNQEVFDQYLSGKNGDELKIARDDYTKYISKVTGHQISYNENIEGSHINWDVGSIEMGTSAFESYSNYITQLDHELTHFNYSDYLNKEKYSNNKSSCEMRASGYVLKHQGLYQGLISDELERAVAYQMRYYNIYSGAIGNNIYAWKTHWCYKIPLRFRGIY